MKNWLSGKSMRWRVLMGAGLVALSLITAACGTTTPVTTTAVTTATTMSVVTTSATVNPSTTATTTATGSTTTTTTTPKPANPELILSSTTSTRDSGLMDVLVPLIEQETGYD